jgi:hypothetical protein
MGRVFLYVLSFGAPFGGHSYQHALPEGGAQGIGRYDLALRIFGSEFVGRETCVFICAAEAGRKSYDQDVQSLFQFVFNRVAPFPDATADVP